LKYDLTQALKAPNSASTWNGLIYYHDQLTQFNREKIREVVNAMVIDPTTQEAIRKHMNVSHRHEVKLRDAFNYLHSTYQAAMEFDERAGDWTCVLRMFPLHRTVYIAIEQGEGSVEAYDVLRYGIAGATPYEIPAPTKKLNILRTTKWREVLNKTDTHFKLDIVTLDNFAGYSSYATESFLSQQHE
jgi:hypothetical protein